MIDCQVFLSVGRILIIDICEKEGQARGRLSIFDIY